MKRILGIALSLAGCSSNTQINVDSSQNFAKTTLSVESAVALKGGIGKINVKLNKPSSEPVQVRVKTSDGSATHPNSYAPVDKVIRIEPGNTTAQIPVALFDDVQEPGERNIQVTLSDPVGAPLESSSAHLTLTDYLPLNRVQGVQALALRNTGGCALDAEGFVVCWGYHGNNDTGTENPAQTGAFQDNSSLVPQRILADTGAKRLVSSNGSGAPGSKIIGPASSYTYFVFTTYRFAMNRTCALFDDGHVQCWGASFYFDRGPGYTGDHLSPAQVVAPGSGLTDIAVAEGLFCGIYQGGTVKCSGSNNRGQLGLPPTGTIDDLNNTISPQTISFPEPATQIAAAGFFACFVSANNSLRCWGDNSTGQLGNGNTGDYSADLVAPTGLSSNVKQISLTGWIDKGSACAVTTDGKVYCWGDGYGSSPSQISGLTGTPVKVSVGDHHACALLADGKINCWGNNDHGQFGNSTTVSSATAQLVTGLSEAAVDIASGGNNSCAVLASNRDLYCWGKNDVGQVPFSAQPEAITHPIDIPALGRNLYKSVKYWTSMDPYQSLVYTGCALSADGQLHCWGSNAAGLIGSGTAPFTDFSNTYTPTGVSNVIDFDYAFADQLNEVCAVLDNGQVSCWGSSYGINPSNNPGDPSFIFTLVPPTLLTDITSFITSVFYDFAGYVGLIDQTGAVTDWLPGFSPYSPTQFSTGLLKATKANVSFWLDANGLLPSFDHQCYLMTDHTVTCLGRNDRGQLGTGSLGIRVTTPVKAILPEPAIDIAAAQESSCALMQSGRVLCWGSNKNGKLGLPPNREYSAAPVTPPGLESGIVAIDAGQEFYCALTSDGRVLCWGSNLYGQLGIGETYVKSYTPTPTEVIGISSVTKIWLGDWSVFAFTQEGYVKAWGRLMQNYAYAGTVQDIIRPLPLVLEGK